MIMIKHTVTLLHLEAADQTHTHLTTDNQIIIDNKFGTGHDWPWVSCSRFNMAKNVGQSHGKQLQKRFNFIVNDLGRFQYDSALNTFKFTINIPPFTYLVVESSKAPPFYITLIEVSIMIIDRPTPSPIMLQC